MFNNNSKGFGSRTRTGTVILLEGYGSRTGTKTVIHKVMVPELELEL